MRNRRTGLRQSGCDRSPIPARRRNAFWQAGADWEPVTPSEPSPPHLQAKATHPSPSAQEFRLLLNGLATSELRRMFCSDEGACARLARRRWPRRRRPSTSAGASRKADPTPSSPISRGSLNNLGNDLSDLGRREEALAAIAGGRRHQKAPRANADPTPSSPISRASLNNLGRRLSNLGRREEALAASQEAVDIRRRLAQTRPDAFLPDLASEPE